MILSALFYSQITSELLIFVMTHMYYPSLVHMTIMKHSQCLRVKNMYYHSLVHMISNKHAQCVRVQMHYPLLVHMIINKHA